MNENEPTLAALAVDYWKLLRSFERALADVPEDRAERLAAQVRFSTARLGRHLDSCGIQLATFDGEELTPAIPVIAVNADELAGAGKVLVHSTIEPAVVAGPRVVMTGRVIGIAGEA